MYSISKDQLKSFIDRIERLEEEKTNIATDIKEVYAEAKGNGFDAKTIRQIIKIRKIDHDDFMEQDALLDLYMDALKASNVETPEEKTT